MRIPLLIDTDPGVDDALAILMAFADPAHDVVGLTVTAGNIGLEHTVANTLKVCEVAGRGDVPVFPGAAKPLLSSPRHAAFLHGDDGFGDTGYAPARFPAQPEHAALAILRLSHVHAGRLLLVTLGPLTNLALALRLDPTLPQRVARVVAMGGAVTGRGNMTPVAEFNVYVDPEAAHVVLTEFPRIELVDWEVVMRHGMSHATFEAWLDSGTPQAAFYAGISAHTRRWAAKHRGGRWHSADPLAMALALDPAGATEVLERPVSVELAGTVTRGATVVDWGRQGGAPDNAGLLMAYDQARFEARVRDALAFRSPTG